MRSGLFIETKGRGSRGRALGDVVYYFTERKEDQSLTEPAEKGRGNGVEAKREEAPVSMDMGQ
jgi:hypothetical protein